MSRISENVGASTSHNPKGLHDLLQRQIYLLLLTLNDFICKKRLFGAVSRQDETQAYGTKTARHAQFLVIKVDRFGSASPKSFASLCKLNYQ
jgi:hypothetical protein